MKQLFVGLFGLFSALFSVSLFAHGITGPDQAFLLSNVGTQVGAFIYLGAKHMVTGYDHLLFLAGVIFFLYRLRDVAIYVTLFAVGHSITLLLGVLGGLHVNSYIVDAIIGLSIVYKAFENGFQQKARRDGIQSTRMEITLNNITKILCALPKFRDFRKAQSNTRDFAKHHKQTRSFHRDLVF